ncbi:hypothetical protein UP10_33660 [Bradyrhizobium sp. LTSPM299]|nr:hypothetical protein UP10_33660 [Bradyrhizobium sp. LTSPM299]
MLIHSIENKGLAMPTTEEFREEVEAQISRASKQGRLHVEINAGEIHRIISPDQNRHAMACDAIRQLMGPSDRVIHAPPAGDGPSFTVRYALPR